MALLAEPIEQALELILTSVFYTFQSGMVFFCKWKDMGIVACWGIYLSQLVELISARIWIHKFI